jgi:hypothetical protein
MPRMSICRALAAVAGAALAAGTLALAPACAGAAALARQAPAVVPHVAQHPYRPACPQPTRPDVVRCLALVRTDVKAHTGLFVRGVTAQTTPSGYGPSDLQSAYDLPSSTAGSGATVAVVDAYNDPDIASDLATYRAQYKLPACTTASGCLRVVNQDGKASPLPADAGTSGWDEEESLDVDMVSAVCPNCKIILVEASSDAGITDLGTAEDAAVSLGAQYVSNSYGAADQAAETGWDKYYDHPGVVITASAGDSGYGVNYPSGSQYVTAVGGTTLVQDSSVPRGWAESVWGNGTEGAKGDGTGSGCSAYEPQPSWQAGIIRDCAKRATADVSADANPDTGVAVYDTYTGGGWQVYGGTSVASPLIAATYALAGAPAAGTYPSSYLYAHYLAGPSVFNDVTTGSNGTCGNVLCNAGPGWDGPTGVGTPHGTAGFAYTKTGSITGTVTDAATGQPVAGARVSVPRLSATTASNGSYTISGLPAGSYRVTVSDYGYQTQASTVALTGSPHASVSGTVTAAAGTAWPLYAQVSWSDGAGHSGTAYTTPSTGTYSLSLLDNGSYTLTITPLDPGYQRATQTVRLGTSNLTRNVSLGIDTLACTALGYHPVLSHGTTETFNSPAARRGWTVTNTSLHYPGYTGTPGWVFTDPGKRGNHTGGTGAFAIVDSGHDGPHHYQDTHLTSPAVRLGTSPAVVFDTDLAGAPNSTATVAVSVNGGKTWASVWRNAGAAGLPGPATVVVPLPTAAGKNNVRIRFGYTGQWSGYWEVDNVFLGTRTCTQRPGALLTGRVTGTSHNAVKGATVTSVTDPSQTATTAATPGDSSINGGLYTLFTTTAGSQQFTAAATGYTSSTQPATVTTGQVTTLSFTLTATSASTRRGG